MRDQRSAECLKPPKLGGVRNLDGEKASNLKLIDRQEAIFKSFQMFRFVLCLAFFLAGCSVEQPPWARTVAAYEIPLPTETDKSRFVELLREEAQAHSFHVDVATPDELKVFAEIPITFRAGIWRGENDEELIASAMDYEDHVGRVWISFSLGQDPDRSARFREALVPRIKKTWPDTRALPIMPSGAIPLAKDLVRTPSRYVVRSSEAEKYSGENNN